MHHLLDWGGKNRTPGPYLAYQGILSSLKWVPCPHPRPKHWGQPRPWCMQGFRCPQAHSRVGGGGLMPLLGSPLRAGSFLLPPLVSAITRPGLDVWVPQPQPIQITPTARAARRNRQAGKVRSRWRLAQDHGGLRVLGRVDGMGQWAGRRNILEPDRQGGARAGAGIIGWWQHGIGAQGRAGIHSL